MRFAEMAKKHIKPDFYTWSDAEVQEFIRYSIIRHEGKMAGIDSIGTSCLHCGSCQIRQKEEGTVCEHCYAKKYLGARKALRDKLELCTAFYTAYEIKPEQVPLINSRAFRFESFGEVQNERQLKNHYTIAEKNKHCTFAIWIKSGYVIESLADEGMLPPDNLVINFSSLWLNQPDTMPRWYADHVFTVYTKSQAKEEKINCGGACVDCLKCYQKGGEKQIKEVLK